MAVGAICVSFAWLSSDEGALVRQQHHLGVGAVAGESSWLIHTHTHTHATYTQHISVSAKFREQLGQLMKTLDKTHPTFVRCIKPNADKIPGFFGAPLVDHQLRCSGVYAAVKISQAFFVCVSVLSMCMCACLCCRCVCVSVQVRAPLF